MSDQQKQYANHVIPNSEGLIAMGMLRDWFDSVMAYHKSIHNAIICEGKNDREFLDKLAHYVINSDDEHLSYDDKCIAHTTISAIINNDGKFPNKKRIYPSEYGYVCLLQSPTEAYKIGRSQNPDNRLKTFSVKLPFEVEYIALIETPDMIELERQLHERFADKRTNGEWFNLSTEDVDYIKGLQS